MIVGDAHGHINPLRGIGPARLAKKFKESGGWLYGLVNLLTWSVDISATSVDDYRRLYDITVKCASEMRREGLVVPVLLGPHPAETVRLIERGVEPSKAAEVCAKAYELAADYVRRGLADGLGEAGRPHWPVPRSYLEACNRVLEKALSLAAELEVPIHLHLEQSLEAIEYAAALARKVGARRVVAHHVSGEIAKRALELGLVPSIPAKASCIRDSRSILRMAVIESDFLDDPRRPGAVVAPWSISRTFRRLIEKGDVSKDEAWKALVENPAALYSVEPPV